MDTAPEKHSRTWEVVWDILLIIAGMLAIGLPIVAGVAFDVVIGWLLLLGGVAHLLSGFQSRPAGSFAWRLLVGVLYGLSGIYLLIYPLSGVASLTLVFSIFFLIEGALEVAAYIQMRAAPGAGWMLLDGAVTLLLGLFVLAGWPASSIWAIGTLVGVSMLLSGLSRLMVCFGTGGAVVAQYPQT